MYEITLRTRRSGDIHLNVSAQSLEQAKHIGESMARKRKAVFIGAAKY